MALYDFSTLTIDRTISPHDTMIVPGREEQYFELGHRALEIVEFAANLCHKPHFPNILDFGCSYARVLRWLRPRHHYATITACDLDEPAIEFCAKHWGATPLRSHPDPKQLRFDHAFDLIWCGSVFTHLDRPAWEATFDRLVEATAECGVIILTLQGRYFASALARKQPYIADDIDQAALLAQFKREGFAYQPYFDSHQQDYGISLASPEWLMRKIQDHPGLIVRSYIEESWGMQDVVILYKTENYFARVL